MPGICLHRRKKKAERPRRTCSVILFFCAPLLGMEGKDEGLVEINYDGDKWHGKEGERRR